MPVTDTYIEKDLAINDEIDKLRLSAVSSLLSGRKDVIVRIFRFVYLWYGSANSHEGKCHFYQEGTSH